jgi:hypothetical protein
MGVRLVFARLRKPLYRVIEQVGLVERIGKENFYFEVADAAKAFRARYPSGTVDSEHEALPG